MKSKLVYVYLSFIVLFKLPHNLFIHAINLRLYNQIGCIGAGLLRMYEYTICVVKWDDFYSDLPKKCQKQSSDC